jgi:hypothetical protein
MRERSLASRALRCAPRPHSSRGATLSVTSQPPFHSRIELFGDLEMMLIARCQVLRGAVDSLLCSRRQHAVTFLAPVVPCSVLRRRPAKRRRGGSGTLRRAGHKVTSLTSGWRMNSALILPDRIMRGIISRVICAAPTARNTLEHPEHHRIWLVFHKIPRLSLGRKW